MTHRRIPLAFTSQLKYRQLVGTGELSVKTSGRFDVWRKDRFLISPSHRGTDKERILLRYLVTNRTHTTYRERITADSWPDRDEVRVADAA